MAKGVTLNQTSTAPDSAASLPMNDLDDWHLYLEMGEASSSRPGTGYFMSSSSVTPWDRPQVVAYNSQHQADTHATAPDPATAALGVGIGMLSSSSSSTSAYPNSPPGSSSSSSSLSDERLSPNTPVECGEGGVSSSLSSFGVGDSMCFAHSPMTLVPSCGPSSESSVVPSDGVPPSLYDGTGFEDEYGTFGGRSGIDLCGPFSSCGRGGGCAPFSRGSVEGHKDGETGRGEPNMHSFDGFVMGMGTEAVHHVQRQTSLPPSGVTEENVNGVCLNDLVMSVNLRPVSSWSTSSSASGTSSSLCLSSSSSLPSSPLEPPAYPGNMPVHPGASLLEPCSPIWAHFPQPDVQVQVQQSFTDQYPYHSQPQYYHSYQHSYEGGTALVNEFGDEVQKRAREERRGMWSGVDTAQLVYSTNAFPEPPPSMSLGLPAEMHSATHPSHTPTSSMSSSPVVTTFAQQYGDVHSMTNMNVPVSSGNTDFQQQQECSQFSYVPSSSTDMQHSYTGGREMRAAMGVAGNDTQVQLFTKFRPPPIDTSIVPSDSHSGSSRPTTSSGLPVSTSPEVMPSPSTTAPSPLEVIPMSGFSGHDAERQFHLTRGIPAAIGSGSGANTFVMNVPPSPYPSLPAGQEQPKVPVGLVRRARERKGSFRMFGRAASASGGDAASSSTMAAAPAPPSQTEDSLVQQHTSSSTESRDVDMGGVSKEGMSESQSPEQARSPEVFNEASGSTTIGGRRMSLRKRKRGEGQESTEESERNEGGTGLRRVTGGTLVPTSEGSPAAVLTHSPEIDNSRVTDEQEDASSEFGRRQRRKRTHPMVSSEGFPANKANTGAGTSPLVASIPSRASADIQMQFVTVPEAAPRPTSAAATTGHGTPTILMKKRGKLPKDVTETLRSWLMAHKSHPYPSEEEKKMLCGKTQLNMSQVSNWMINARRRILVPPKKKTGIQQAAPLKPRPVYSTNRITPSASVPSTPVVNVPTLLPSFNPPPSTHPRALAPSPSYSPTSRRTIVPLLRRAHALSRSVSPGPKSPADPFAYPGPLTQYPGPVPRTTPHTTLPSGPRSTSPQTSTSYETAPVPVPGGNIQTYPQPATVPMTAEQLAAYGYSPAQASYLASKTSSLLPASSEDEDSSNATHL